MEINIVVDRSSSSPGSRTEDEERTVRLKVADGADGTVRLGRLLRTLAATLERSRPSEGADTASGGGTSLRVAVKLPPGILFDRPGRGSERPAVPLPLRPPPTGSPSAPNRADLEFVSHELRTPINAVMGYTSLLRERVYGELSADQAEAVDRIRAAARNLLGALDHLRDVAELDLGRFEGNPRDGDHGDDERRTTGDLTV